MDETASTRELIEYEVQDTPFDWALGEPGELGVEGEPEGEPAVEPEPVT